MPVIDLLVGNDVRKYPRFITGMSCDHHEQGCILDLVDTAGAGGCQHITASLRHHHIQVFPADIPNREKCARSQPGRFFQVCFLPERDHLPSAVRILFDIRDQVFDQIIPGHRRAVALADRPVPDIPGIPPCHAEFLHFGDLIGGFLINCKDLPNAGLPGHAAQCQHRKITG